MAIVEMKQYSLFVITVIIIGLILFIYLFNLYSKIPMIDIYKLENVKEAIIILSIGIKWDQICRS